MRIAGRAQILLRDHELLGLVHWQAGVATRRTVTAIIAVAPPDCLTTRNEPVITEKVGALMRLRVAL